MENATSRLKAELEQDCSSGIWKHSSLSQSRESLEPKSNFWGDGEGKILHSWVCIEENDLDKWTVCLTQLKWRCIRVYIVAEL